MSKPSERRFLAVEGGPFFGVTAPPVEATSSVAFFTFFFVHWGEPMEARFFGDAWYVYLIGE